MTETPREQEQEKKEGRQRTQLQGQPVPSGPRRPPVNRAAHGPLSPLSASTSLSQALPAAGTAGANGLQRPLLPRRPQKSGRLSLRLCVPPSSPVAVPTPRPPDASRTWRWGLERGPEAVTRPFAWAFTQGARRPALRTVRPHSSGAPCPCSGGHQCGPTGASAGHENALREAAARVTVPA